MTETEAYFAIVETPIGAGAFARRFYQDPGSPGFAWFLQVNRLAEYTRLARGTILVVPSAQARACSEAELRLAAALRDPGVRRIEQPEVTNRLYEVLAFTQAAQTPGGLGAYAFATQRQIDEVTRILRALQALYRRTYDATGALRGEAFFQQRRHLLQQLDGSLRGWLRHVQENRPDRNRRIAGETGRLAGSVGGGALGGFAGYGACNLVFGAPSAGTSLLWCAVIAGGVGAFGGGYALAKGGPIVGERIYDVVESVVDW